MAIDWDISEVKGRLDKLMALVRSGEEVVLWERGAPVVRLSPAEQNRKPRIFGEFAGKIQISDDFAAPLDPHEHAEWAT